MTLGLLAEGAWRIDYVGPPGTLTAFPSGPVQELARSGIRPEADNPFNGKIVFVGATFPDQAKKLRKLMPKNIFLVPGYGAQGGTAADVAVCFNKDGLGAVVNSSRGITFAWENSDGYTERDYAAAARQAVLDMKKNLHEAGC